MGLRTLPRETRLTSRLGRASIVVATMLAMPTTFLPAVAFAQPVPAAPSADAKTSLANGDKAARAKDWPKAFAEFDAANRAQPSADALEGVANAHYQQKHDADAYAAYDEWVKTYGAKAPKPKTVSIEARLKELRDRTGLLTLDVSEAGATVTVDDKPMGATPLAAPLRLAPGPHRVRVAKDGFVAADIVPNVTVAVPSSVTVKLETQTTKGRLSVKEKTGKPLRVLVDGVDMGEAPWSGEVEAGSHDVGGRGGALLAAPEKVTVERGKTRDVELVASLTSATLKVSTSDSKGLIYLDGKLVGEGTFSSDIPAGAHALRITREGYDPFEEQIDLKDKDTLSRTITLKLSSKIETGAVQKENRPLEGIYGGFGLLMTFLPGGMHHSMQTTCEDKALTQKPPELGTCSGEGGGFGGGINGFVGYHWDPVGVELFAGAQYDQSSPTLNWVGSSTDPGIGSDPARTEEFTVRRIGGFAIFRIRVTVQGEKLRFSMAGGVGLSYRSMLMTRDTTTTTANPQLREAFVPDAQTYLSPVISLDPSIQYRLGAHTAVALGLSLLVESPRTFDQIPTTPQESGHKLGAGGLTTPQYELATSTQIFIGPFIGMMFGP
jgi:PEGA domain